MMGVYGTHMRSLNITS